MGYDILAIAPTSFFADYGCHVRILEEGRALARRGHRVTVCTYHNGRDPEGVRVLRMPRVPWHAEVRVGSHYHKLYFDALLAARSLTAAIGRVDVVHAHMHDGALIGYLVSRLRRVPLVFDYQGSLTREMVDHQFLRESSPWFRPVAWLEQMIERLPDAILTSSTNAADALRAARGRSGLPTSGSRIFQLAWQRKRARPSLGHETQNNGRWNGPPVEALVDGVDLDSFGPCDPAAVGRLRARYRIPTGRDVVGYIGLMAEYQGVGQLLFAARRVVERRPNTHFLIMGYPGWERYQQQAHDLQILDHVTFTGRVPYEQCALHLALADVAVSAKQSASEANGKLLNYMAMGLPTVVYETPVARELLGDLGVYAAPGDVAALADALLVLLDDPLRRAALGAALRQRVALHFSWDSVAARLEAVYTRLRTTATVAATRQAALVD
ncbi:MAG: glycosyltransferase [Chloroflexota bacterium]|nr:glycosyltransferase [Chloroflexota bacterium]